MADRIIYNVSAGKTPQTARRVKGPALRPKEARQKNPTDISKGSFTAPAQYARNSTERTEMTSNATYTKITEENVTDYPTGTRVLFNYGAMCGEEEGTVTGHRTTQFGTELIAETDDGETQMISGISTIGIGVYLI